MISGRYALIDWGTSNFRAYLVDGDGHIIDRRQNASGILAIPQGEFEMALLREIGPWLRSEPDLRVLMSGMIGSRQGWVEVPYVECPATIEQLAQGMISPPGDRPFMIVPGLRWRSPSGHFDVMRGEETQIFGAVVQLADEGKPGDGLYCLPGTHSKWAKVESGRIVEFATYMTGEVFAVLCNHSVLGRMMTGSTDVDNFSFDAGIELAMEDDGVLSHLFAARADVLMGQVPESGAKSYLSGILIGHELRDQRKKAHSGVEVIVVGAQGLCDLYCRGLERIGFRFQTVNVDAASIRGLRGLAALRRFPEVTRNV